MTPYKAMATRQDNAYRAMLECFDWAAPDLTPAQRRHVLAIYAAHRKETGYKLDPVNGSFRLRGECWDRSTIDKALTLTN